MTHILPRLFQAAEKGQIQDSPLQGRSRRFAEKGADSGAAPALFATISGEF